MLRAALLALIFASGVAVAGAGCSTATKPPLNTQGTNGQSSGGGSSGGDGGASSSSCTFASSPVSFTLPTLGGAAASPFTALTGNEACEAATGTLVYSLVDMNDDGGPDLVVTSACDDATVGQTVWLVYPNTGSGFATTPSRYALPPATSTANCATVSIFDTNGDFIPDWVQTTLCDDATVGTSRWLVYLGAATGFAQTATPYALPPGYSTGAFATTAVATDDCAGSKDVPAFALFDINGDNIPDFVLTESCTDATVGTNEWRVYLGSASGASQTSTSFALPTTPTVTSGAFDSTEGTLSCTTAVTRPTFELFDFNIDGKINLVVTQQCDSTTVGTSSWLWYENSGQGFAATPATITLPTISGAPNGSFTALSATGQCTNGVGAPTYTLADIDDDAVLDMLVTRACGDSLTGVSYWDVYPSTGSGFSSPPRTLTLPSALNATLTAPAGLIGAQDCTAPARPAFTTTYLAGVTLDIVVTSECSDSTVGNSRWLVFPATCP